MVIHDFMRHVGKSQVKYMGQQWDIDIKIRGKIVGHRYQKFGCSIPIAGQRKGGKNSTFFPRNSHLLSSFSPQLAHINIFSTFGLDFSQKSPIFCPLLNVFTSISPFRSQHIFNTLSSIPLFVNMCPLSLQILEWGMC